MNPTKHNHKRTSHEDQIGEWADYIREHPTSWREQHTRFINAQIEMANAALERILQQKNGKKKIIQLFGIKNKKLIHKLGL